MGKFSDFVGEANPSQGQFTFTVQRLVTMKKNIKDLLLYTQEHVSFFFFFFFESQILNDLCNQ